MAMIRQKAATTITGLLVLISAISPSWCSRSQGRNVSVITTMTTTQTVYAATPGKSLSERHYHFAGYAGSAGDIITAAPGVLAIIPGNRWSNFIKAANDGYSYNLKNVLLTKRTPELPQCGDVFPPKTITQHGSLCIRLFWPLLYEVPGTTWELQILYGTPVPYDNDGPEGPNKPSYVHLEKWIWKLEANFDTLIGMVELFHYLPMGKSEVPLISNDNVYAELIRILNDAKNFYASGNPIAAGNLMADFEFLVSDYWIDKPPVNQKPTANTGIAGTECEPAACALMVHAAHIANKLGLWTPAK